MRAVGHTHGREAVESDGHGQPDGLCLGDVEQGEGVHTQVDEHPHGRGRQAGMERVVAEPQQQEGVVSHGQSLQHIVPSE